MSRDTLVVNEIFFSIQGESHFAGRPCVFVRLTGCNLRCRWCDTGYAFHEGERRTLDEIWKQVESYGCDVVEITGGEPLLQPGVHPLMTRACDAGKTVLLETSGSVSIAEVDERVARIVDLKCPGSGESDRNCWDNVALLGADDEVKFVVADRADYEWARGTIAEYDLSKRCHVSVSPVFGEVSPRELAEWILADGLDVRLQLQLHKFIWDPGARGV